MSRDLTGNLSAGVVPIYASIIGSDHLHAALKFHPIIDLVCPAVKPARSPLLSSGPLTHWRLRVLDFNYSPLVFSEDLYFCIYFAGSVIKLSLIKDVFLNLLTTQCLSYRALLSIETHCTPGQQSLKQAHKPTRPLVFLNRVYSNSL
jgi:hypothetical protein